MSRWTRREFVRRATAAAAGFAGLVHDPRWAQASKPASDDAVTFLTPASPGYASSATPFNRRIKTRPALIAICRTEAGAARAVRYAADHNLRIAVKSGGHSFEGLSLNADGIVIDVSAMDDQQLADEAYTAGPGVKLAQAYDFLLPRGRLLPMGSCGTVGLSGLTLGGGYGMFSRQYGLTCDQLTGIRMVDGNGQIRDSSDDDGLLWACRGGGNGNFGVITQMRFKTQIAPERLPRQRIKFRGLSAGRAASLCERWFEQTAELPTDAFSAFVLNGSTLTVLITHFAPENRARIQGITDTIAGSEGVVAKPANERLARAVQRYYGAEKPLHFKNVSAGYYESFDDLRDRITAVFQSVIDGAGLIFQINTLGGAIADPALQQAAAYPHRAYPWLGELQCYWDRDSQTDQRVAQVNALQRQLHGMGIRRHYRNYPSLELEDWADAYYGREAHAALQACKRAYDPDDRIGHAQSVKAK